MNRRTVVWSLDNDGGRSVAERGLNNGAANDDTGDKHRKSSTLTAIGGNDGMRVCGDSDSAGVGKWVRGNSNAVGLALTRSRNGMSGDSGVSFSFSC